MKDGKLKASLLKLLSRAKSGLSKSKSLNETDPEKVEQDLLKQIPKELYYDVNHLLVWHGRKICDARKPKCDVCPVSNYCKEYRKKK